MIRTLLTITFYQVLFAGIYTGLLIAFLVGWHWFKNPRKVQHNFPPPPGTELGDKPTWAEDEVIERDVLDELPDGSMRVVHMCKDDEYWFGRQ